MQFTDHGIEGVVPPDLLPPEVRSKYHAKPSERNKRAKKEDEQKNMATQQPEDNQVNQGDLLLNFVYLIPNLPRTG